MLSPGIYIYNLFITFVKNCLFLLSFSYYVRGVLFVGSVPVFHHDVSYVLEETKVSPMLIG